MHTSRNTMVLALAVAAVGSLSLLGGCWVHSDPPPHHEDHVVVVDHRGDDHHDDHHDDEHHDDHR